MIACLSTAKWPNGSRWIRFHQALQTFGLTTKAPRCRIATVLVSSFLLLAVMTLLLVAMHLLLVAMHFVTNREEVCTKNRVWKKNQKESNPDHRATNHASNLPKKEELNSSPITQVHNSRSILSNPNHPTTSHRSRPWRTSPPATVAAHGYPSPPE